MLASSSVRQDRRSASLTAPNGSAQRTLLQTTWARAGVAGREVQSIETHGTGTALGDPTEAGSLASSRGAGGHETKLCIGAAKAFIGHGEAPSGMSGLLKARRLLMNAVTPGNAHLRMLNPLVAQSASVLRGSARAQRAPACGRANDPSGVSSFGFSGTIAHALLRRSVSIFERVSAKRYKVNLRRRAFGWIDTYPWKTDGRGPATAQPAAAAAPVTEAATEARKRLERILAAVGEIEAEALGTAKPIFTPPPSELRGRRGGARDCRRSALDTSDCGAMAQQRAVDPAIAGNLVELDKVVEMAASVVGGDVDADVPLMSAGLDSLGAVELSELLQKAAGGAELPGTLVFDQPTARRLTGYLATRGQARVKAHALRRQDEGCRRRPHPRSCNTVSGRCSRAQVRLAVGCRWLQRNL